MKKIFYKKISVFIIIIIPGLVVEIAAQEKETVEAVQLPEITVSATPLGSNQREYGEAVSIMNEDQILSRSHSTLGETVGQQPGVHSSYFGQGASRPIIRGFSGERVRVLKNGVSTGDVSDISEDHVVVADPMQAKQIEILRGPETLLYGSTAIGGVVNVTDDSISESFSEKPFSASFLGQLGDSADNEKTTGLKLKAEHGDFIWTFSGFGRTTDDYEIPGQAESDRLIAAEEAEEELEAGSHQSLEHQESAGKVANSDSEAYGATIGGSYVFDRGFFGLSASGFSSEYGIPGHMHADEHEDEHEDEHDEEHEDEHVHQDDVRIDAKQARMDFKGRYDYDANGIESIKYKFGVTDYEHDEIEGDTTATTYERDAVNGRVEILHEEINGLRGAVGIETIYDDFSAVGEESFLQPVKTWAPALFFFEEKDLQSDSILKFGARVEYVDHDPESRSSASFIPFSVSAGPLWYLGEQDDYQIGFNIAYSERAPSAVELFSDGQHLARQIYEVGNDELNNESSVGIDLMFSKSSGFLTGAFTPFYQSFFNYLNLSANGESVDDLPVYSYEGVDASFWGFELESAIHIDEFFDSSAHKYSLEYQIDYVRARDEENNSNLPRISPLRNIFRARYAYLEKYEGFMEAVLTEAQEKVADFELPTSNYVLLNAEASVKLAAFEEDSVRFFVRGTNLTNDEARVHNSFIKDLAPLRGRAFLFGLKMDI